MTTCRVFGVFLGWLLSASLFSAPRIPVEDFAREPNASRAQLSPDGKRLDSTTDFPAWKAGAYPKLRATIKAKHPGFAWP